MGVKERYDAKNSSNSNFKTSGVKQRYEFIKDTNDLITKYNTINTTDYSKYGDYSSHTQQYSDLTSRANNLLKQLDGFKKLISEDDYKKISDTLNSIATNSDTQKGKLQQIIDFYSSFEDENEYKRWETDNRLYAENGDLTPENVDYFIDSMEKRKAKRELNGYEQEFYDWIKNYDLTHGYKDEEYYNKRLEKLKDKLTKASANNVVWFDDYGRQYTAKSPQYSDIEGKIGDIQYLRNQYLTENAFYEKGYSKYLQAEDFYSKYNIGKTAVNESIDNRGEQFAKEIWDKITMNDAKRATERHESIALTSRMEKYLTEDEKKVYYYLLGNGEKSDEFKAYRKDMINASNQRWNEDIAKDIDSLMNFDTVGGAIATIGFNLLSVPANVIGGGIALTSATLDLLGGNKIDVNNSGFFLTNFAQSVRSSTGDMIDSAGWNLVYNAVMSTADSLFAAGVFGKAAPFVLAGSAAASRMKELVLQGASDVEIVVGSLASGLIEVVTEKISIDRLFDGDIKPTTFKQFFAEGLKQATIEGREEIASEVLNRLSDEMLRGSMSDYNQAIRRYEAEGLSKSEATKKAANDVLVQIAEAALSGMISGGIGGSVAGGIQMHKFNVIGSNIIKGNNVDTVLMAAEYMGSLEPEINGQVEALKNYNKTGKNGKTNAAYKRTLGKVAATVAENVTEVKQSVTEKAVSNELKSRGVDAKTVGKVSKIVSKFLSGQKLSSSEQGYLQHNSVAATVMQEIKVAQEQVKAQAVASSPTNVTQSTQVDGAVSSTSQSSAPQWAVDLVQKLTTIDSAKSVINLAVKGKSAEDTHNSEVNRMIKILSIASGKTTAEQEAEAGDIPYSQYIKEKEAAAKKENTAENDGEESIDGENIITMDMPDSERAEILENTTIEVVEYDSNESPLSEETVEELKYTYKSKAYEVLKKLCEKFGVFKDYSNNNVSLDFNYSRGSLNESVHKQNERGGNFSDFAKMLSLFDDIVSNAQPIECHSDKYVGTKRENKNLKQVYVLLSVFSDGQNIIPVEFNIKEFKDETNNQLYVSVTLNKIEVDLMGTPSEQSSYRIPKSTSTYSLPQIIENINPSDGDFLKYIPDELLNEEQLQSKNEALEREETRLEEMRNDYLRSTVSEETVAKRKKSVEKLTKLFGLGLEWSESVKRGKYNPNSRTVVLNPNLTLREMYLEVLKHEFTHDLENRKLYTKFKNFLFESSKSFTLFCEQRIKELTGETIKGKDAVYALRGEVYMAYKKSKELTEEERNAFNRESAEREMVCDFVAKKLLAEENEEAAIKALTELAENQPTIWERFTQWLKDILFKIKHSHNKTDSAQEIEYLERLLKRVYDSKVDKNKIAQEGEAHNIVVLDNGNTYVSASRKVITGTTLSEQRKDISNFFKKILKNKDSLDIHTIEGDVLTITKAETADKARDNYKTVNRTRVRLSDDEFSLKLRVASHIDEIAEVSVQKNSKNDSKNHSFAKVGFTYRTAYFEDFDGAFYKITFSVGNDGNTATVYNVGKIEKSAPSSAKIIAAVGSRALDETPFDITVPQKDTTVNSNSMQDIENHSIDLEENVSENEGTATTESFSIPTETAEKTSSTEAAKEADITEIPDLMAVIADRYKRGELTDEEYRIEVQDLLMRANEKYGPIKQGEKAENKTQIPQRVTSDKSKKTKRFVRTVHESGILSEDMEVELDARILKDMESYQIIGDKAAQRQANLAIERGTAVKEWEAAVNGDGRVGKREIAIGETLLKLAAERKDSRAVMKLIAEVSEMGTRAGQIVQAMSMLKRMDGVGQLYYVQKCVERINRDLDKRFARKVKKGKLESIPQVKINETLANQLAASKTQQDFEVTYEAMMQSIADQVPATFLDKWNAWRYFAMLFNPRTHIRNFGGNLSNLPTVRFKDLLAASIEKIFLGEEQRTKSVVVKKEYQKFAEEDYPEIEAIITGGGKMNPSDEIRDRQNVFDTKWLEKLRKWNFDLLEKEDAHFLKKHYAHALGGFLQARNIDITKDIDPAVMEEARKYAMVEAQKATYRDASAIADILQRASRTKSQVWNSFVEGVLPFKKTPINIVRRGIEYSPIGLIKTLTKGTIDLKNEKISASQYIDGIAGGLTGTGIVLLGMLLSSLGFIKITGGFDDDEEDDLNRLLGRQEYAVEIGGASYTIDWMAPVCIPFFMGVEIQKALEEEGNGNLLNSVKNVGSNALEPIINLSMLSGMQDVISSAKYSEGSAVVGSVLWNIVLSYGSQAVPSIFGATARTIDGTRRTTYIDKTSWMSDMGQMAIGKLESKFPFASMLRSEYVDEFGRTEDNGNVFVRAIQNFISPGYYSKIEDDPVIEQLKELYEETGEGVLPSKPKKYIDVGGEKKHLTADEYEEYAKEVGQERYEYLEEFFGSSNAKNLTSEEKREVISNLYSYAQAKGKTRYSEYKLPDLYKKVYEAEKNGVSPVDYYLSKIATSVENADTDGSGTITKKERLAAIRKMNVSNDIKAALIALYS